jgi:hypothetical protein
MDESRSMTGDGSREMDDNQAVSRLWRYWGYVKLYHFWEHDSGFKLQIFNGTQTYMNRIFRWHGSTEYDTEHYSEMPKYAATGHGFNAKYNAKSDPESHLQCGYCPSHTWSIFGCATIFQERDHSAEFATMLNSNNCHTGSAGTKHRETHSPIGKASNCEVHPEKWWQMHLEMKQEAACPSYHPYWDSNSVSVIPTQSGWYYMSHGDPDSVSVIPTQSQRSRISHGNPESVSVITNLSWQFQLNLGNRDPVSAIPIQSKQSWVIQLPQDLIFRIYPNQSIWHQKMQ